MTTREAMTRGIRAAGRAIADDSRGFVPTIWLAETESMLRRQLAIDSERHARAEARRNAWRAAHPWRARWRDVRTRLRDARAEIGARLHYAGRALRGDWPEPED